MDVLTILAGLALFAIGWLIRDFIGVRVDMERARDDEPWGM